MATKYSGLFYIILWLLVLQCLLLAVEQMVFSYSTGIFFSRSMVTMLCMAAITGAMIIVCRRGGYLLCADAVLREHLHPSQLPYFTAV